MRNGTRWRKIPTKCELNWFEMLLLNIEFKAQVFLTFSLSRIPQFNIDSSRVWRKSRNLDTLYVVDARQRLVGAVAIVSDDVLLSKELDVCLPVEHHHSRHRTAAQHRIVVETLAVDTRRRIQSEPKEDHAPSSSPNYQWIVLNSAREARFYWNNMMNVTLI